MQGILSHGWARTRLRVAQPRRLTLTRAPGLSLRLALTLALGLAAAGAANCAKRPPPLAPPPPPVDVNIPAPPARPMPTANRQLLDEARKAGLEAREVDEGVIIYLPTVFLFEFDQATLTPDARKQLREVGRLLTGEVASNRRVTVEGHADAVGTRAYNRALADRRAVAVIGELVASGVPADRIGKRVFGEDKPLEPNRRPDGSDNPEGRAKNRRVALLIENPTKKPGAT